MKLYLNENQRAYLLEVFDASKRNAIAGSDLELAEAFNNLYEKISPTNALYYNLSRGEAESVLEFCEVVIDSLEKATTFLNKDTERDEQERQELLSQAETARAEMEQVRVELSSKIKNNPSTRNTP
jgi:hypothetical protein